MTTSTNPDGSEDVNDFLQRIRELGERRNKEDEERTRKLEDEILQGRKERQARRAERARSIAGSPTLNSSRVSVSSFGQSSIEPPEHLEPTLQTQDPETPNGVTSPTASLDTNTDIRRGSVHSAEPDSPSRTMPTLSRSRAGTLSWQQRPSSRGFGSGSPGSTSPTRSSHLRNTSTASDENRMSCSQIALSLGSKDPSWFRQTPDRGLGSPAYRKPEEHSDHHADLGAGRRLPGLSRESTVEPEKTDVVEQSPPSPPRTASTIGESSFSNRYSSVSSVSQATELGSPVPSSDAQKLDPSLTEAPVEEPMPPSPSQRRMSPERPRSTSPTKGLGGFVQSAMMKRSDSVTKRWSAQIPQRPSRGNSFIGNRNSVAVPSLTGSVSEVTSSASTSELSRETSPLTSHRPGSSHSEVTVHPSESTERPATPSRHTDTMRSGGSPGRPALYGHARSTSSVTAESQGTDGPASPFTSRTIDPKRWSPTKASWLESALNRPETPRHQKQSSQQPSWVTQRQSRGSVDMGRVNNFKEVTPVGLMRTPPPGGTFKKSSISGTSSIYGSPSATKAREPLAESPFPAAEPEKPSAKPEQVAEETKPLSSAAPGSETSEPRTEPEKLREPETTPEQAPEPASKPSHKEPPSVLSPKPNSSLPSREPLSPKAKPQSPAIDFRANLRKREVVKDSGPGQEPEFKNVFGKLKRTETRNYVAPDELKDNILRGKAALNATGGPKKTQRVDELKESLLKQKDAMKAGGGSIRIRRNAGVETEAPAPAVPEAIAKRTLMGKTNSITRDAGDEQTSSAKPSPEQKAAASPANVDEQDSTQEPSPAASEPNPADLDPQSALMEEETAKDVAEVTAPEPKMERKPSNESASSLRGLPSARRAQLANAAAAPPNMTAKGKLAGRINPALAGLLSRGPPSAAEGSTRELTTSPSPAQGSIPAQPSAPLTHMTKGRARGPKRRLPKTGATAAVFPAQGTEVGDISPVEVQPSDEPSEPVGPSEPHSASASKDSLVMDAETAHAESPVTKQLPPVNTSFQDALNSGLQQRLRSSRLSSPNDSASYSGSDKENATGDVKSFKSPSASNRSSRPPVPPKPGASPSPSPSSSPSTSVKGHFSQQGRYASASPSPLRTSCKENTSATPATPATPTHRTIPGFTVADSSPRRNKSLPSPPVPPKRADISLGKPADHRLSRKMSAPSLVAQAAEAREVIACFFKSFPNPRDRMDIDPQLMLTGQMDAAKIRTVKRQIWEITGDGKRQELPINQEYVLYEGSMYLCVHSFEGPNGNSPEVYLWCGDDVPESARDDAHLFARKVARENGCKLEVVRQGKEPVRFIQALGGIIITRRGSSSRHTSSALYMLCGRKHLGQMAFDEVDYSLRNLCSGFPFVISAPFGKLYLWKGKGSGPEETGAARLISMDLGLTGEFEEVEEGQEPESFFDVFAGSNETNPLMISDYWQLKPKYAHYRTRLLRVDHQLGQPPRFWGMRRPGSGSPVVRPNDCVQEIEPFCYKDLTERDVYVLDTFFEIWVIVGDQAPLKSADFASAVVFAHEYGILAASLQDRPFIPKSFVSLGGTPDRCQSAFRKWNPRSLHAPCVFPLDVAIEALRSPENRD